MTRNYQAIAGRMNALIPNGAQKDRRLALFTEILWEALSSTGVSWCGFYLPSDDGSALFLARCRPKPACSPIGLHGVCGKVFLAKRPLVIQDVGELGEGYVACDPRDRSEIVVPLIGKDGTCWAVLDLDSHETGAFAEADAQGLASVLCAAGLQK